MKAMIYRLYRERCTKCIRRMADGAYRAGKIDGAWRGYLFAMAESFPSVHTIEMLRGFLGARIRLVRRAAGADCPELPAVLCVEKNGLRYLRQFLPYYRARGFRHFVIVDNASTDGTTAYLLEQKDVTLYSAPFPFEHHRQAGWQLQAIQEIGADRWYLRADVDEFLSWPDMDSVDISTLIHTLRENGMGTFRVLLADMYSSRPLLAGGPEEGSFLEEYACFDDAESYVLRPEEGNYFGGMRGRVLGMHLRMDKYALLDTSRGYLPVMNHDTTGIQKEEERGLYGIFRHYKLLPSEREKIRKISKTRRSGYGRHSEIQKYARLLETGVTALYAKSLKYHGPESIRELSLIQPLPTDRKEKTEHDQTE